MSDKVAVATALLIARSIRPSHDFLVDCGVWGNADTLDIEPPMEFLHGNVRVKASRVEAAIREGADVHTFEHVTEGPSKIEGFDARAFQFSARYMPFLCFDDERSGELGVRVLVEVFERWQEFPSATVSIDFIRGAEPVLRITE